MTHIASRRTARRLGIAAVAAVAAILTACAEEYPVSPGWPQPSAETAGIPKPPRGGTTTPLLDVRSDDPLAGVPGCDHLHPPAGSRLAFRAYAKGVQIYHWNGSGWAFDGPSAVLSADREGKSVIGTHYAGPKWESASGGIVSGSILERCTPNPDAIEWLLLGTTSTGPGPFHGVTRIQRVNTVGGKKPARDGAFVGEEVRVEYSTEYWFYRPGRDASVS